MMANLLKAGCKLLTCLLALVASPASLLAAPPNNPAGARQKPPSRGANTLQRGQYPLVSFSQVLDEPLKFRVAQQQVAASCNQVIDLLIG